MNKSNYTDVLLESMNDKMNTILEIVVPMRQEVTEIKKVVADIPEIKADIRTIKAAVHATNQEVKQHDRRIDRLELKVFG